MTGVAPVHSPGHVLGRSHGNNPVDISLDARVGPTSRSRPVRYRASGIVFGPRYSTRIALVTPPPPHQPGPTPCTGVTYPLEMSWGQGTPGGDPPFPIPGPPATREPVVPGHGDNVAALWRSLNSGGCRTAHHCSANPLFPHMHSSLP